MVKNKEREHHWLVTQERALETYEKIQSSTDCDTWEIYINSNQKTMSLKEFIKYAEKRMDPLSNDGMYSPSTSAVDCMTVLLKIPTMLKTFSENLEHAFRGVIIVNEDMNKYVESLEDDNEVFESRLKELQEELDKITQEKEQLEHENKIMREGFAPLKDILLGRVSDLVKLMDEFKKYVSDEKQMKNLVPYIQKEIEFTFNLIDARRKYLLGENIPQEVNTTSSMEQQFPSEKVSPVTAVGQIPPEFQKYPEDIYFKAVESLSDKIQVFKKAGLYEAELKARCNRMVTERKKKAEEQDGDAEEE